MHKARVQMSQDSAPHDSIGGVEFISTLSPRAYGCLQLVVGMDSKTFCEENSPEAGPSGTKDRTYAAVVAGLSASHWSAYQSVGEDEAMEIALKKSREDVQVHFQYSTYERNDPILKGPYYALFFRVIHVGPTVNFSMQHLGFLSRAAAVQR